MPVQFLGPDPLEQEIREVLAAIDDLAAGRATAGRLERLRIDLKEEAGRRGPRGQILPGLAENEAAATALAGEAACMANTAGGGALIVGVEDNGTLIGTDLDGEWLRHRIYQLTQRRLTVDVRPVLVAAVRLLVLRSPEALEPIPYKGKVLWRVDDHCVEVDAATVVTGRMVRLGFDWSAQTSNRPVGDARAVAIEHARRYLRAASDPKSLELAAASTEDLLRRLNVVTADGHLTNAGALAFIGRDVPALDYLRRDLAGGDSRARVNERGRSLLEELAEIEQTVAAYNPVQHIERGLVIAQIPQLPTAAVREAIVNGVAHRDWITPSPTVIEHVGATLVVSSPGGFVGGVTPANIITHPSQSRNMALASVLAALRVAEREGIGVDRMVRDMIRVGYEPPAIEEITGPQVRTALVGGNPNRVWLDFLTMLTPEDLVDDLDALLLLRHLTNHGWVDAATAAPTLQRTALETGAAIDRVAAGRFRAPATSATSAGGRPMRRVAVVEPVEGVPANAAPAWRLTARARDALEPLVAAHTTPAGRRRVALHWARTRGRISTTELGSIVRTAANHAGKTLKELEQDGFLAPGRQTRAGRGFFYLPLHEQ